MGFCLGVRHRYSKQNILIDLATEDSFGPPSTLAICGDSWVRVRPVREPESLKAPKDIREYDMVMRPVGLGPKNYHPGEGQQQFSIQPTQEDRPLPSSKMRPQLRSTCFGKNKILTYRSRRDMKPRMPVLARTSNNVTDRPADWPSYLSYDLTIITSPLIADTVLLSRLPLLSRSQCLSTKEVM
jgi:hypothetical protein